MAQIVFMRWILSQPQFWYFVFLAKYEFLQLVYSVEKLEINGRIFFCRKPKHSELRTALGMQAHQ
jgi:hypothetical protein